MAVQELTLCPRCQVPLVKLGEKFGRVEWACERHADPQEPCSFRAYRLASDDDEPARCPHCGCAHVLSDSQVSHTYDGPSRIRRRRICRNCGLSFHTREVLEAIR
jgi:hypothetical protein